ncbi:hypothetical protein IGI04_005032 [Brassica rapa subsp. trilocularis]|uniref:PABS domain-containing protein n=1 Tax=Brassica rapa subsp. trilocularis TaxID=1813537 RepID=A0ABQ7NCU9_BRACM|nr:hypothetical protein IGI04_005032 [Brassica rapa subsp. trilocularis]
MLAITHRWSEYLKDMDTTAQGISGRRWGESLYEIIWNGFPESRISQRTTSPIQTLLSNQKGLPLSTKQPRDDLKWSFALKVFPYRNYCVPMKLLFWTPNISASPKTVFIMGGGERLCCKRTLKHKTIENVEVLNLQEISDVNSEAFVARRLNCERCQSTDTGANKQYLLGDLADPVEGGPCYQLYTKSFYQNILKPKLSPNGIFVTQAGPAGIFTHKEVFTSIYNTMKHVFKHVKAYTAHVPSFADTWGWVMASDQEFEVQMDEIDQRIEERVKGELMYLNAPSFLSAATLNKTISLALEKETEVYSEENARFIHGHGVAYRHT